MSDEDRPRKSWREIDRQKDRSAHRKDDRDRAGTGQGAKGPRRERSYRAALDRLFDSGKIGELVEQTAPGTGASEGGESRFKALARIKNATDADGVTRAVDAFVGDGDLGVLPDDFELLGRVLEHRSSERKLQVMLRIEALLERERPKRARAIVGQLRIIREVAEDEELVALATRLIERLG